MVQEIISIPRANSGYTRNLMVDSCVFKDDESESEAKTNSGPRVCLLLLNAAVCTRCIVLATHSKCLTFASASTSELAVYKLDGVQHILWFDY